MARTEFQQRIADWFLTSRPLNGMASRWHIAQAVFPERWRKRSGRGALIGHVDRACQALGLIRLPPEDRWDDATFCLHGSALEREGKTDGNN